MRILQWLPLFLMTALLSVCGCDKDDPDPDDDSCVDDLADDDDSSPSDFCGHGGFADQPEFGPGSKPGAASPFGTGDRPDVVLGDLEDPSVIEQAESTWAVDYNIDLATQTYDLYIPADYDGSEPYGLLTYIEAGDNGGSAPGGWHEHLDQQKLIWVSGDGIGNSVDTDIRIGTGILAVYRMCELFNIDMARIYASGNSGGARSSHMMSYLHPGTIDAACPKCGAAFIREVEQAYETQEPDSHYEFWGDWYFPDVDGDDYATYLHGFNPRYALMTSYDDFREGDIMNIYHHGMEADGFESRLLDVEGGHCSTNGQHFADALGFLEHPLFVVVDDPFDDSQAHQNDGAGDGFLSIGAGSVVEQDGQLKLLAEGGELVAAVGRNRLHWHDSKGLITRLELAVSGDRTQSAYLGLWAQAPQELLDPAENGFVAGQVAPPVPGLMLQLDTDGTTATMALHVFNEAAGTPQLLFEADFEDWEPSSQTLPLKFQVWDHEFQVNLGQHLGDSIAQPGVRLLDDKRTIQVRWEEVQAGYWSGDAWSKEDGCLFTVAARGQDDAADGAELALEQIQIIDATGIVCE